MNLDTKSISKEIYLPKSKPFMIGILYRPPDKIDIVTCLHQNFINTLQIKQCHFRGDFNMKLKNLQKLNCKNSL